MKRILLVGNPNVGKSVVFSRLTGANVVASNYPGTTVDITKGILSAEGVKYEVVDVPGTYSLKPTSKAEEVAAEMLEQGDIVINVLDATKLERNLSLTFELLNRGVPTIVALNMWDEAQLQGVDIDVEGLSEILGVPVVPVIALTGEGIKELVTKLPQASVGEGDSGLGEERWARIGAVVEKVQQLEPKHPSLRELFSEATIKPLTGIPIALVVLYLTFQVIRFLGEGMITYLMDPLFQGYYAPAISDLAGSMGPGLLKQILFGRLSGGDIHFLESMGVLTTGLYVPFAVVLPYIIAFYFLLSVLEDSGYLPRLATLADNFLHKVGIHGQGIISILLGLGCNVGGVLAARTLETRRERFIASTLIAISVPCTAQSAMIVGILGTYGMQYVYAVFGTLLVVYLAVGFILNRLLGGESPEIFLDIPPYRRPSLLVVFKKTLMRVRWFLKDALPWLLSGIVIVNVLYSTGFLSWLGNYASPIITGVFGLPKESVTALLVGVLRKDLAVGMLVGLGLSPAQLVIAATVLTIYFPCAATFAVLFNELGIKDLVKSIAVMVTTVVVVGFFLKVLML